MSTSHLPEVIVINYIFDTNSLSSIIKHYFPSGFPSFWDKFRSSVEISQIISVREVKRELGDRFSDDQISHLITGNKDFFESPTNEELAFITEIYRVMHFKQNMESKKILSGGPFADPFVIAKGKIALRTVVTEEVIKPNGAKIPNICDHFSIPCINFEGFLTQESWRF